MFDVLIVGGGVIGCLIARELTKYKLSVCLLEKEADVAEGASGANSGIVHAGFDPKAGTLKARFNLTGNEMFERLASDLSVPFIRNGSLVLAFGEDEEAKLRGLMENGARIGVPGLALLGREEVLRMEPLVSPEVMAALWAPSAGITCPYTLTIAAAENAAHNGATLLLNQKVMGITRENGAFCVRTERDAFHTRFLVNAAGVYADEISALAGAERYAIKARRGQYLLLDKNAIKPGAVLFQAPTAMGKGVLVSATVHGNLLVGPSAEDTGDKEDTAVTAPSLAEIAALGARSFPHIRLKDVITEFSGIRAIPPGGDFIIEPSQIQKGLIHVAGISSPGLTAAPAIAAYVARLLADEGLNLEENKGFDPLRRAIPAFAELSRDEQNKLIAQNPAYGRIVCRCETISEAEVVESIRRGASTLDGVKRRVRAGMGRCQGGFCSSAVMEILARELQKPLQEITKNGEGSNLLVGKTK